MVKAAASELSENPDPASPQFGSHRSYESDLVTALEAMDERLAFVRRPVADWPGIWLLAATPGFDIVGGGITILQSRTLDASGRRAIAFTSGHIAFRQSLLTRSGDAARLVSYDRLTSDVRVGVLRGTTGEARLLRITGIANGDGVLARGTRIETPDGTVVADGTADYTITAASASAGLERRTSILPPSDAMPQVVYLGDVSGEEELRHGWIEVVAGVMFSGKSEELIRRVRRALIAGPFGPMGPLLARAERIDKLHAICVACGDPATRNQRLIDGKPAPAEGPTIQVGRAESYEARCRRCHDVPERDRAQRELLPRRDTEEWRGI